MQQGDVEPAYCNMALLAPKLRDDGVEWLRGYPAARCYLVGLGFRGLGFRVCGLIEVEGSEHVHRGR